MNVLDVIDDWEAEHMNENMVVKLWRGEYSLPVTYWLFGVVGGSIAGMLSSLFAQAGVGVGLVAFAGYLAYILLVWKGIWTSAGKRGGFWGGVARVYIGVGVAVLALGFVAALFSA